MQNAPRLRRHLGQILQRVRATTHQWFYDAMDFNRSDFAHFEYLFMCNTFFNCLLIVVSLLSNIGIDLWSFLIGCSLTIDLFTLCNFKTTKQKCLCTLLFCYHLILIAIYTLEKTAATPSDEERQRNLRDAYRAAIVCTSGAIFTFLSIHIFYLHIAMAMEAYLVNKETQRLMNE